MNDKLNKKDWILSLIQKYEKPLIGYAVSLLNDIERAKDAVQDTFVKLCHIEKDKIQDYTTPWLYRVCRNRSLDIIKKNKRISFFNEGDTLNLISNEKTPDKNLEISEEYNFILSFIEQLPKHNKEIIKLKFQHDLTYKEISQITGKSVSNVGFIIHNSLKKIKDLYQKHNETIVKKEGSYEN